MDISNEFFLRDLISADLTVVAVPRSIIPCGAEYGFLAKNSLDPDRMKYRLRQSLSQTDCLVSHPSNSGLVHG